MDIDDVYVSTGEFGKFQKRAFIANILANIFCGTQMVQNVFAGHKPDNITCQNANVGGCSDECSPDHRIYCDSFNTFTKEWKLGCDQSKADSIQSLYMLGVMAGSFMMGGIGDKYGRFKSLFMAYTMTCLLALISSFMPTWETYAASRFLTGFFLSGVIIIGFVLMSELVGPSKRVIVGTIPALAFAIGICILALSSWIVQDWRENSTVLAVFGILCIPAMYFLYEESPRWHLARNNIGQCEAVLQKISSINGHTLGAINLKVSKSASSKSGASMLSLFKNKLLLRLTLIQLLSWYTNSSVYYGLTLASGAMGGNRYVSVALNAIVEVPSNILALFLMNYPRLGRVRTCVACMIFSSICCGAIIFISDTHTMLIVGLACAGKFFICMSFSTVYVQGAELYPTPVRNVGLGLLSVANRVGGVVAPLVLTLENIQHNAHFAVFGILGCISGLLCWTLPETIGKPLPETPEDIYTDVKKRDKDVVSFSEDKRHLLHSEDRLEMEDL